MICGRADAGGAFAFGINGKTTQINAILIQQIEGHEHQLAFVRVAGAHLGHQPVEMSGAAGIDQDQLAVEDGRLRGQLAEGLDHARQAVGVFGAVARIEPNLAAILDDLEAKAIPFGLVQPIVALGRADGCGGAEGADDRRDAEARDDVD